MIKRILLFLSLSFIYFIHAQTKIERAIEILENDYAQEKVYLLLDKDRYLNGDNIWFKSYVFDGYQLSSISTTLLVELYDHDKKLLDKKTILLKKGEGNGSFTLADTLEENVYFIRAYTPLMANFPEELQTIKPVLVYNPESAKRLKINENNQWTASLFPEGGTFISELPTKFAVRLNNSGLGTKNWTGYVIDVEKPNEKLTTFKGLDENVASFNITGKKNKKYQAVVEDLKGNSVKIDFPEVSESGISLQVKSDKDGIFYTLHGNKLSNDLKNYKIVGTINNQLAYDAKIISGVKDFSFKIPSNINNGLNGVLLLTVFDENEIAVAQRLCFIKPDDLNINKPAIPGLNLDQNPRSANEFTIQPEAGYENYSVLIKSVSEDNSLSKNEKDHILSTLWLSGDFSSKIENPLQYFSKENNPEALDALLITEKWTRFDWKKLLAGTKPTIKYKTEKYLSYKGRVAINGSGLPSTAINFKIDNGSEDFSISQAVTDDKGYFTIDRLDYQEPVTISYYLNTDGKYKTSVPDNLTVTIQPMVNFVPLKANLPVTKYQLLDVNENNELPQDLVRAVAEKTTRLAVRNNEALIEEVKIKKKKVYETQQLNKELTTFQFKTLDASIFDFVNNDYDTQGYTNIVDWLRGKSNGVKAHRNEYGVLVPNVAKIFLYETEVDANVLNGIAMEDIAMVKIFKHGLVGSALSIYLKTDKMYNKQENKERTNRFILPGYDQAIPFEQPNYSNEFYNKMNTDFREVLYWNANLQQELNLPVKVKYYNNDSSNKIKMTLIAFNKDGVPLIKEEIIK